MCGDELDRVAAWRGWEGTAWWWIRDRAGRMAWANVTSGSERRRQQHRLASSKCLGGFRKYLFERIHQGYRLQHLWVAGGS